MDETAEERREKTMLRLRRIEGQVRGIQRMLEDRRECEEVLTQLMAVRSSIDQVGVLLFESHIEDCLFQDLAADPAKLRELKEALKIWTRFGLLPGASSPLQEP
jgi:DNA-binding FrmR family transcriptional regulator